MWVSNLWKGMYGYKMNADYYSLIIGIAWAAPHHSKLMPNHFFTHVFGRVIRASWHDNHILLPQIASINKYLRGKLHMHKFSTNFSKTYGRTTLRTFYPNFVDVGLPSSVTNSYAPPTLWLAAAEGYEGHNVNCRGFAKLFNILGTSDLFPLVESLFTPKSRICIIRRHLCMCGMTTLVKEIMHRKFVWNLGMCSLSRNYSRCRCTNVHPHLRLHVKWEASKIG